MNKNAIKNLKILLDNPDETKLLKLVRSGSFIYFFEHSESLGMVYTEKLMELVKQTLPKVDSARLILLYKAFSSNRVCVKDIFALLNKKSNKFSFIADKVY